MGGDLFVRSRAGVTRTALGERLIPMLADLVKRADEVMAAAAAPTSGPLRFGNMEWTPPTLRGALQSALPAVELQTITMDPATAVEGVQNGTLTAALVPSITVAEAAEGPEPALGKMLIVREPVWLALPLQHPLAGRHSLEATDLARLGWVRYSQDHWFHAIERQLFAAFDHPDLEILHRVDGHREAMNWVRDLGVAALTPPPAPPPTCGSCRCPAPSGSRCCWCGAAARCPARRCASSSTRCGSTTGSTPARCPDTGTGSSNTPGTSWS
ncbi:LysR substrate-binding domain-containing protein [Streptomyces sp. G45]|uniref:LysR substrate-binding domain-containing protein n=1 Tax=Streptomyces sp. G45 TaxID=3406627 RepID=UPI003C1CB449